MSGSGVMGVGGGVEGVIGNGGLWFRGCHGDRPSWDAHLPSVIGFDLREK